VVSVVAASAEGEACRVMARSKPVHRTAAIASAPNSQVTCQRRRTEASAINTLGRGRPAAQ
jgi:hypothetical protein